MVDSIRRLHDAVVAARDGRNPSPRTERLFHKGRPFIAKKLAEEGVEVALDAVMGDRAAVVRESADLLYNLVVLWVETGIAPDDVWAEMERREQLLGMAEKLPKSIALAKEGRQLAMELVSDLALDLPIESGHRPPTPRRRIR